METSETMLRNAYQKSEYLARIEIYKQDQINLYNLYLCKKMLPPLNHQEATGFEIGFDSLAHHALHMLI